MTSFSIVLNLDLLFIELFYCKEWAFLVCRASPNRICIGAGADTHDVLPAWPCESVNTVNSIKNSRHCMISSIVRKIKTDLRTIECWFASGMKYFYVNLDRETTFLALYAIHGQKLHCLLFRLIPFNCIYDENCSYRIRLFWAIWLWNTRYK